MGNPNEHCNDSKETLPAVEVVLYEGAPDIVTVDEIAEAFDTTESRARAMIEDAIEYGTPRIEVNPVGYDVYHVTRKHEREN